MLPCLSSDPFQDRRTTVINAHLFTSSTSLIGKSNHYVLSCQERCSDVGSDHYVRRWRHVLVSRELRGRRTWVWDDGRGQCSDGVRRSRRSVSNTVLISLVGVGEYLGKDDGKVFCKRCVWPPVLGRRYCVYRPLRRTIILVIAIPGRWGAPSVIVSLSYISLFTFDSLSDKDSQGGDTSLFRLPWSLPSIPKKGLDFTQKEGGRWKEWGSKRERRKKVIKKESINRSP